jgi:competence protein ComEC
VKLHRAQLLFWSSIFFLAGIAEWSFILIIFGSIILLIWYWLIEHIKFSSTMLLMGFVLFSWWGGQYRFQHYLPNTKQIPYDTNIEFSGLVIKPPNTDGANQKLYISSNKFPGYVYIKTFPYPEYHYGDFLTVRCKLMQPKPFTTFAFDKYLARYGVLSICQQAKINLNQTNQGNWLMRTLYNIRTVLRQRVRLLWPEPAAGLILGIVLGVQDDLFADISANFRTTGTVHILVVSGMHVVIIAQVLTKVFSKVLSRKKVFIVIVLVLSAFSVITGLAASVIRASFMGVLPLLATIVGRKRTLHYSLALVAAIIVLYNPYILKYDVGFQLSFLATLGIIYLQPLTQRWCKWLPSLFEIKETLTTTLAAMLTTTPLIISVFGTFSLVAPVANLIVVPVSNIILFAGVGILGVSIISINLTEYLAYILWLIIKVTLYIVAWLANLPLALIQNIVVPNWVIIFSFCLIIIYIIWNIKKSSNTALS